MICGDDMKTTLGDIFDIGSGGTPSKAHVEYYGGDIPWVKTGDLKEKYLYSVEDYITDEGLKNSSTKMYEPGTVLMAMYGATIGATSILKFNACTNQACAAFKPCDDVIPEYLYYFLRSKKQRFISAGVGGAQPNISAGYLKKVAIDVCSLDEQKKVISALDKVNQIISERRQELMQLDDLIKARFVEMFGDSVANPMKWPVKKLKDLSVQINSGNTPKGGSENYVDKGITFFRSQNVWKDRLEMDDIAYIDEATHASMKRSSLKHGDILMTKTGRINTENSSLGRAALYMGEDDMANVNGHVYFIRLKPEVNNKFVLRILVSAEYRALIRSVCVGGIDKRQLNKEHIEDFPIICPPSDKVDEYVAFVGQVDKSKTAINNNLEETKMLFDSLMQEYFG